MQPTLDLKDSLDFTDADLAENRQGRLSRKQIWQYSRLQRMGCIYNFPFITIFSGSLVGILNRNQMPLNIGSALIAALIALVIAEALTVYFYLRLQRMGCIYNILIAIFSGLLVGFLNINQMLLNIESALIAALIALVISLVITAYFTNRVMQRLRHCTVKSISGTAAHYKKVWRGSGNTKSIRGIEMRHIKPPRGKGSRTSFHVVIGNVDHTVDPTVYHAFQEGVNYTVYILPFYGDPIISAEMNSESALQQ